MKTELRRADEAYDRGFEDGKAGVSLKEKGASYEEGYNDGVKGLHKYSKEGIENYFDQIVNDDVDLILPEK